MVKILIDNIFDLLCKEELMEKSQMRNIVVLKNLPSNLIEEALVIVKSKKNAKTLEYIDKKENVKKQEDEKDAKNYIIREAESVINSYIHAMEKKDKKQENINIHKKYKMLKIYSILATILMIIGMIL